MGADGTVRCPSADAPDPAALRAPAREHTALIVKLAAVIATDAGGSADDQALAAQLQALLAQLREAGAA